MEKVLWISLRILYFIVMLITIALAISVTTWAFNKISLPLVRKDLAKHMAFRASQATPGVLDYYWVQEHGALHLEDEGQGMVHIGFAGIDGNGRWVYNPEKNGRAWFEIWTTTASGKGEIHVKDKRVIKMSIGDEIEFGGYHIKLVEIRVGGEQFDWVCLEVRPIMPRDGSKP